MDRETRRLVEEFRRNDASAIDNNLIDELVAGELDRQEFLRRAAVFGLGAGTIGMLLRYIGEEPAFGATLAPAKVGGTSASAPRLWPGPRAVSAAGGRFVGAGRDSR